MINYLSCGVAIGFVEWFRPGGIILIVALILTDLIYLNKGSVIRKQLIGLILLFISFWMVSNLAVTISESFFQSNVMSTLDKRGYFILIGLNPNKHGHINFPDVEISYNTYRRFKGDNSAANAYLIQLAIDRLRGNDVWGLFSSKFIEAWSNHENLFGISLFGSDDYDLVEAMYQLDSIIYLFITIFIGFNVYSSYQKRSHPAIFTMQLFILGTAFGLLILEIQNRYTIIAFPYLILLGSLGLKDTVSIIFRNLDRFNLIFPLSKRKPR